MSDLVEMDPGLDPGGPRDDVGSAPTQGLQHLQRIGVVRIVTMALSASILSPPIPLGWPPSTLPRCRATNTRSGGAGCRRALVLNHAVGCSGYTIRRTKSVRERRLCLLLTKADSSFSSWFCLANFLTTEANPAMMAKGCEEGVGSGPELAVQPLVVNEPKAMNPI